MVEISRTTDMVLVRFIVTDSRIYGRMSDDFAPDLKDYVPLQHDEMIYLRADLDGAPRGIFALIPHSRIMYEIHTCLLPEMWGSPAAEAAQALLAWTWANTSCLRLITSVPAFNRTALAFAKRAGLTEYGTNPMSYMKRGQLWDITMLGISKPEVA